MAYDGSLSVFQNRRISRSPSWLLLFWLIGLAWTAWISLLPGHRLGSVPGSDKVWHAATYLLLASPICFLFPRRTGSLRAMLFLVVYGVAIEIGQQFIPARSFEWADILANTSGATAGLILSRLLAGTTPAQPPHPTKAASRDATAKPRP